MSAGLTVVLFAAAGWAAELGAGSAALLKAKPAVVLVTSEVSAEVRLTCPGRPPARVAPPPLRSNGSGYLISPDGYIATNAHVLASYLGEDDREVRAELLRQAIDEACVAPGAAAGQRAALPPRTRERLASTAQADLRRTLSVVLANGERFIPEVKAYSPPLADEAQGRAGRSGRESGKDVAILKIDATNLPRLALADSDRVRVGEPLRILGYPGVVLDHDFLDRRTALEVTITSGLVSSLKRDTRGTPVIQTDAAASWGNSGGPAVDERGEVVGMLTFISLTADEMQAVQGFNFLVPSNVVREFARAAGATASESAFNTAWHDAVDRVGRGDWAGARGSLDAADRLVANLPDVKRLRAEVEVNLLRPRPAFAASALGATAAALAALGAVWAVRRYRRRPRPKPPAAGLRPGPAPQPVRLSASEVARAMAQRLPLALVDVRSEESYRAGGVQAKDGVRGGPGEAVAACAALPRDHPIVLYCDSPGEQASMEAARALIDRGYTRVGVLAGGFQAWQEAGLALTRTRGVEHAATPPLSLPPPTGNGTAARLEARGEFPVGVKGERPYFNARATAVRMTGLTLEAVQALAPGEGLRLAIFLGGETLELSGRVASVRPDGGDPPRHEVEVAFDPLPEETATALEGFILAHRSSGLAA